MTMHTRIRIAIAALATFLCVAGSQASPGRYYGHYMDGVYTAPGRLFRISAPFPDGPSVSDGREPENNNAGAVSFIDSAGRLLGILYMENDKSVMPAMENPSITKALGSWFRDTGFPGFFKVSIPDAKILREEPGQIAGMPAWIAVAHLPKASPLGVKVKDSYDVIRNDSWRGMAVVARGKHLFLLQTELRIEALAGQDFDYNADAADWNVFVPELEALYQRIEFLKP